MYSFIRKLKETTNHECKNNRVLRVDLKMSLQFDLIWKEKLFQNLCKANEKVHSMWAGNWKRADNNLSYTKAEKFCKA